MKPSSCEIYIVRHGESEANVQHIIGGDYPLTPKGEEQAATRGELLKEIQFDLVFSSDLLRAKRTAEILLKERELAVATKELLREQFYGDLEGKSYHELELDAKKLYEEYENLLTDDRLKKRINPTMETAEETIARFITFLREVSIIHLGKRLLVVCHGDLMRVFLLHIGKITYEQLSRVYVKNTGYIVLETDGIEFNLKETVDIEFGHEHKGT